MCSHLFVSAANRRIYAASCRRQQYKRTGLPSFSPGGQLGTISCKLAGLVCTKRLDKHLVLFAYFSPSVSVPSSPAHTVSWLLLNWSPIKSKNKQSCHNKRFRFSMSVEEQIKYLHMFSIFIFSQGQRGPIVQLLKLKREK